MLNSSINEAFKIHHHRQCSYNIGVRAQINQQAIYFCVLLDGSNVNTLWSNINRTFHKFWPVTTKYTKIYDEYTGPKSVISHRHG
jgi:hypothetical protein